METLNGLEDVQMLGELKRWDMGCACAPRRQCLVHTHTHTLSLSTCACQTDRPTDRLPTCLPVYLSTYLPVYAHTYIRVNELVLLES